MNHLIILLTLTVTPLLARAEPTNDEKAQIAAVEQLYRLSAADHSTPDLAPYVSDTFKQTLDTVETLAQNEGMPCLEMDPIWGNQDPEYNAAVDVHMFQDGRVLAQFNQHNQTQPFVLFAVLCQNNTCKIDDIYHSGTNGDYYSLKTELNQCVEENIRYLREEIEGAN